MVLQKSCFKDEIDIQVEREDQDDCAESEQQHVRVLIVGHCSAHERMISSGQDKAIDLFLSHIDSASGPGHRQGGDPAGVAYTLEAPQPYQDRPIRRRAGNSLSARFF
jgi:hypothetical protein